ncbi:hypothetical protein GGTG_13912 [Gaeumannomyces tritici R3-111a-1]|uniref:Uncharacterized protein n=1 Tax=Gaeumannomyces tritici (strain R3-111a-1) TaxID=644352 RepID=J3PK65_GAET3|nr:hypothetical protein GGTG_13912 [Gaeumannomyces tritici R3-111a-1]EJT68514.1 hypothetical protein GGTG_13912 [Gaeumannomyces tritici R3-111a-1]
MDTNKQQNPPATDSAPNAAASAPPTQNGQRQPWVEWFGAQELDTKTAGEGDGKPQTCSNRTRAAEADAEMLEGI